MPELENKSYASEAAALEELHRAFSAFRETNDERLGQIERRLTSDVVTEEKLSRIDRALDETKSRLDRFALDNARPRIGGAARTGGRADGGAGVWAQGRASAVITRPASSSHLARRRSFIVASPLLPGTARSPPARTPPGHCRVGTPPPAACPAPTSSWSSPSARRSARRAW